MTVVTVVRRPAREARFPVAKRPSTVRAVRDPAPGETRRARRPRRRPSRHRRQTQVRIHHRLFARERRRTRRRPREFRSRVPANQRSRAVRRPRVRIRIRVRVRDTHRRACRAPSADVVVIPPRGRSRPHRATVPRRRRRAGPRRRFFVVFPVPFPLVVRHPRRAPRARAGTRPGGGARGSGHSTQSRERDFRRQSTQLLVVVFRRAVTRGRPRRRSLRRRESPSRTRRASAVLSVHGGLGRGRRRHRL